MTEDMAIFNRSVVRLHRTRAKRDWASHAFLFDDVAERLSDRLDDVKRTFPLALDLGGKLGTALGGRGGIETRITSDLSSAFAPTLVCDEEALPFKDESFDLVMSNLSLHWVNDLPGSLIQIRRALKKDGMFLATMLGGDTLKELRQALLQAESEIEGGLSPRVSPFADVRDAGALLQRAGFALPVVDAETITVSYANAFALMKDLRGMGESNAVAASRKGFTRRATLMRASQIYHDLYADDEGRIPATFQILTLTGWSPDASQPKACAPGSATTSLADVLK